MKHKSLYYSAIFVILLFSTLYTASLLFSKNLDAEYVYNISEIEMWNSTQVILARIKKSQNSKDVKLINDRIFQNTIFSKHVFNAQTSIFYNTNEDHWIFYLKSGADGVMWTSDTSLNVSTCKYKKFTKFSIYLCSRDEASQFTDLLAK